LMSLFILVFSILCLWRKPNIVRVFFSLMKLTYVLVLIPPCEHYITLHRHLYLFKAKQSRNTPWRRLGERRYSSYLFLTSDLDGSEWSASRPGCALAPGIGPPVPIVQEAWWAPEPVWTKRIEEKSFAPAEDRTPIARSSSP
jgi:hypothetical protein